MLPSFGSFWPKKKSVYFKVLKEVIMTRINQKPETGLTPKKVVVDPRFTKAFLENVRTYFK
jgi:hypothetical protein